MNDTLLNPENARPDAPSRDSNATPSLDTPRHDAAYPDTPRHDATRDYSLTLDEVATRFERAGLPRSLRTLQRWCASGRLDGLKTDTVDGERYFVDLHSVERAITELRQLSALTQRQDAPGHDSFRQDAMRRDTASSSADGYLSQAATPESRHDAPRPDMAQSVANEVPHDARDTQRQSPPSPAATPRHDATEVSFMTRYVERVESENIFLREQVDRKDQQIASLLERDKETNFLVRGLQQMLSPLLGGGSSGNSHKTDL